MPLTIDKMRNQIFCCDCIEAMAQMPSHSIDMVLCDLPYGGTHNYWDLPIPLDDLWGQYRRVTKPNAAIVLTATQPFASQLIASNTKMFRYDLIWEKNRPTGFLNSKRMPLRSHESILVFYRALPTYNPQKTKGHKPLNSYTKYRGDGTNYGKTGISAGGGQTERLPTSILRVPVVNNDTGERIHPTQKPVELFEYLIMTYTNPGELVLDNCMGGGTTPIACLSAGRDFVGIELHQEFFDSASRRIDLWRKQNNVLGTENKYHVLSAGEQTRT